MTDIALTEYLTQEVEMWRSMNANPGAYILKQFLLRNAQEMPGVPRPRRYRQGIIKQCYNNSWKLVKRSRRDLTYVEGYCYSRTFHYAFQHAWVVDERDELIDITLDSPENYSYIGVKISKEDYIFQTTKGWHCVFDTGVGINIDYIVQRDPSFIDELPEKLGARYRKIAAG